MPIHVELTTPERLVLTDEVDFLAVPATDGEIGILPGHAPLLARLGAGAIRLKKGGATRLLAISGGFLEVQHGSRVALFAETAELAEDIDVERARHAAERAKQKLTVSHDLTAEELAQVELSLVRAIARIKVGEGRWHKGPHRPSES